MAGAAERDGVRPSGRGGRVLSVAALAFALVLLGLFGWWWRDLRWRPHPLARSGAAVERLLFRAVWISPGLLHGPVLYMVSHRDCPDCLRYASEEFARLQAAGVDVRVVVVAPRQGSTPLERATVAELWSGHDWSLYQDWTGIAQAAWTAPGVPDADASPRRRALIERGRALVDRLSPLLAEDGVRFDYPLLVWRDPRGRVEACIGDRRERDAFIRRDLAAPS